MSLKGIPSPTTGVKVSKNGRAYADLVALLTREFANEDEEREAAGGSDVSEVKDDQNLRAASAAGSIRSST